MTKRLHVFFSGRVQGVGFRYSVREIATGFDVTGFVKNLPDGRVELAAEGAEDELQGFLADLDKSHLAPFVRHKEVSWSEASGEYKTFSIAF